jgi:hypothetical protein
VRRLDAENRFLHAAVRAIATCDALPAPPAGVRWWDRAGQHGILSLLATHLPSDAAGQMAVIRRARAVHHLRAMAALRALSARFRAGGTEFLVFKGPVLSEVVYQRPCARGYGDLDLLVRPSDVAPAVAVLEELGARPTDGGWRAMLAIGDGESAYALPNGTVVDLHWDVINDRRVRPAFAVDPDVLFARSREVTIDGLRVRTLDEIDTVLHVALHACQSGGDRLRWLLDIQQSLLRCAGQAEALFERAVDLRLDLVLRLMVNRVDRFLGHRPAGLPTPSVLARSWLELDSIIVRRFPPGSRYEGRFSGAIVSDSTRARPLPSWGRLAMSLPATIWGRRRDPEVAIVASAR